MVHELDETGREADDERDDDTGDDAPEARPVRRYKKTPAAERPSVALSPFGSVPQRCTHWGVKRQTPVGGWEPLGYRDPSSTLELREWPLAQLSEDTIRERWGAGTYRLQWYGTTDTGGRASLGQGRYLTLHPVAAPPPPPAPVAAPPALGGFTEAIALMDLIDRRATGQLAAMTQLANLARGDGGAGTTQLLVTMMQQQQEQTRALIEAMREDSRANLRAMREIATGEDASGSSESTAAAAAGKAAGAILPAYNPRKPMGEQAKAAAVSYFVQNPGEVFELVKSAPALLDSLAKLVASSQAAQASAPPPAAPPPTLAAPPPAAPRRVVRMVSPPPEPGINGAVAEQASQAPPVSTPSGFQS